jgi:hypothetical protein
MAEPTKKHTDIRNLMNKLANADTEKAIQNDTCIPPPIGCGGEAVEFKDERSKNEYIISGLCQECQDNVFGE